MDLISDKELEEHDGEFVQIMGENFMFESVYPEFFAFTSVKTPILWIYATPGHWEDDKVALEFQEETGIDLSSKYPEAETQNFIAHDWESYLNEVIINSRDMVRMWKQLYWDDLPEYIIKLDMSPVDGSQASSVTLTTTEGEPLVFTSIRDANKFYDSQDYGYFDKENKYVPFDYTVKKIKDG